MVCLSPLLIGKGFNIPLTRGSFRWCQYCTYHTIQKVNLQQHVRACHPPPTLTLGAGFHDTQGPTPAVEAGSPSYSSFDFAYTDAMPPLSGQPRPQIPAFAPALWCETCVGGQECQSPLLLYPAYGDMPVQQRMFEDAEDMHCEFYPPLGNLCDRLAYSEPSFGQYEIDIGRAGCQGDAGSLRS